jgi:ribosomal protein L22
LPKAKNVVVTINGEQVFSDEKIKLTIIYRNKLLLMKNLNNNYREQELWWKASLMKRSSFDVFYGVLKIKNYFMVEGLSL